MTVDAIVDSFGYGVCAAEIAEQFEIPPELLGFILTRAENAALDLT